VFAEPKGSTSICQGFRGWSVKKLKNNLVLCPCKVIQNHCFWCQSTAREWLRISDHISHDSASVVRATFKVYGKRQTLTLSQPKTSEPIVTKFEWTWTSPTNKNSLGLIRPWVFDPHIDEIYTPSSKLTTLFLVLQLPTGKSIRPIFTLNTSNDAVLRKEVLLYCYKIAKITRINGKTTN